MTDIRIVTCTECNGDGGGESSPYGYNHVNGAPLTHWIKCTPCDGTGEVEVEVQPIEMDDLDVLANRSPGSATSLSDNNHAAVTAPNHAP